MSDRRVADLSALVSGVRFGQFVSVGAIGAVVDTIVLVTLAEVLGVFPEVATVAGIETAILVMFLVNDRWTFADEGGTGRGSFLRRLLRSHAVRAVGSTTQFVVFVVVFRGSLAALTGDAGAPAVEYLVFGVNLWLLAAKGTGIALGMLVNYVFESLFTWKVHE
jgi:putative flippase GtrA